MGGGWQWREWVRDCVGRRIPKEWGSEWDAGVYAGKARTLGL
jgi:hypothetical protein